LVRLCIQQCLAQAAGAGVIRVCDGKLRGVRCRRRLHRLGEQKGGGDENSE